MNKGIILINDFLSSLECQELIDAGGKSTTNRTGIQNDVVPGWKNVSDIQCDDDLNDKIANIHQRVGAAIVEEFEIDGVKPREDGYFYHYGMGDFYRPHCDAQTIATTHGSTIAMRKPSSSDVSSILYLNDNFIGGELEFGFQNQKIKPKAGMLVLFYSGWENTHCVHPMIAGHRYAIVNWFVAQPYLVPTSELIPQPYAKSFELWEQEYIEARHAFDRIDDNS